MSTSHTALADEVRAVLVTHPWIQRFDLHRICELADTLAQVSSALYPMIKRGEVIYRESDLTGGNGKPVRLYALRGTPAPAKALSPEVAPPTPTAPPAPIVPPKQTPKQTPKPKPAVYPPVASKKKQVRAGRVTGSVLGHPDAITCTEYAHVLGVSRNTVGTWARNGRIPASAQIWRDGQVIGIRRSDELDARLQGDVKRREGPKPAKRMEIAMHILAAMSADRGVPANYVQLAEYAVARADALLEVLGRPQSDA